MNARAPLVTIMAGGTGGHIFPGLAVAQALRARGAEVRWLGAAGGMETRLVPPHDIAIDTIAVAGLRGKGIATLLSAPLRVLRAVRDAARVLRQRKPDAVVSFGGYAAGPGGIAARIAGIPLLVHEQNRAAGLTNKVLAAVARRVLVGFPQTFANEVHVGNPVRAQIAQVPPPAARDFAHAGPLRLLVLGGSQGARVMADIVPPAIERLEPALWRRLSLVQQVREEDMPCVRAVYDRLKIEAELAPFFADLPARFAATHLVF